jgi:hypothetical protein
VIPNDNEATKKCGKKIFSFAKNVLQQQQSQPETVFVKSILQSSLAKKLKQLLHENDELYYKVYDISTL